MVKGLIGFCGERVNRFLVVKGFGDIDQICVRWPLNNVSLSTSMSPGN